ncbi:MAG: hypothetical protein ACI83W_002508 [Marinoscillum sp.]|jgi:hypothetical protein
MYEGYHFLGMHLVKRFSDRTTLFNFAIRPQTRNCVNYATHFKHCVTQ